MQNRVTIALWVLLACICSAWATHYDMMASSASKICRNFHFSYTYSRCLRNLTSQSDSTSNFDLFKKKKIKNALFVTILQRLFQKLPQKSNFLEHLFFNNWAISKISKKFSLDKIFWNVYNVWFKFGVVHTLLGAPGDFTWLFWYTRNFTPSPLLKSEIP